MGIITSTSQTTSPPGVASPPTGATGVGFGGHQWVFAPNTYMASAKPLGVPVNLWRVADAPSIINRFDPDGETVSDLDGLQQLDIPTQGVDGSSYVFVDAVGDSPGELMTNAANVVVEERTHLTVDSRMCALISPKEMAAYLTCTNRNIYTCTGILPDGTEFTPSSMFRDAVTGIATNPSIVDATSIAHACSEIRPLWILQLLNELNNSHNTTTWGETTGESAELFVEHVAALFADMGVPETCRPTIQGTTIVFPKRPKFTCKTPSVSEQQSFCAGILIAIGVGVDDILQGGKLLALAPADWTEPLLTLAGTPVVRVGHCGLLDVLAIHVDAIAEHLNNGDIAKGAIIHGMATQLSTLEAESGDIFTMILCNEPTRMFMEKHLGGEFVFGQSHSKEVLEREPHIMPTSASTGSLYRPLAMIDVGSDTVNLLPQSMVCFTKFNPNIMFAAMFHTPRIVADCWAVMVGDVQVGEPSVWITNPVSADVGSVADAVQHAQTHHYTESELCDAITYRIPVNMSHMVGDIHVEGSVVDDAEQFRDSITTNNSYTTFINNGGTPPKHPNRYVLANTLNELGERPLIHKDALPFLQQHAWESGFFVTDTTPGTCESNYRVVSIQPHMVLTPQPQKQPSGTQSYTTNVGIDETAVVFGIRMLNQPHHNPQEIIL